MLRRTVCRAFPAVLVLWLVASAQAAQVKDTITLSFPEWYNGQRAFFEEVARVYESLVPGVEIEIVSGANTPWNSKKQMMITAGHAPDISPGGASMFANEVYSEIMVPIPDQYLTQDERAAYGAAVMEQITVPGVGIVALPYALGIAGPIVVNKDLLARAGYDTGEIKETGWTWEEFRDAMSKVAKDLDGDGELDIYGLATNLTEAVQMSCTRNLAALGVDTRFLIDPETGELNVTEEQLRDAIQFTYDMIYVDRSWPRGALDLSTDQKRELLYEGRAATVLDGTAQLHFARNHNAEVLAGRKHSLTGKPSNFAYVPYPHRKGSESLATTVTANTWTVMRQLDYTAGIPQQEHIKNVLDFADYLTRPLNTLFSLSWGYPPADRRLWAGSYCWVMNLVKIDDPELAYLYGPALEGAVAGTVYNPQNPKFQKLWQEALREEVYPAYEAALLNVASPAEAAHQVYTAYQKVIEKAKKRGISVYLTAQGG